MPATPPDPQQVITDTLSDYLVPDRTYPRPLPEDLAPWYCYTVDGGHSIVVVLASLADPEPTAAHSVPIPVRTVLRTGWEDRNGWIVADVPYDETVGVVVQPGDDEF